MTGHPAPDHCIRAAASGCGCKRCIAWRKAKEQWRNGTPDLFGGTA